MKKFVQFFKDVYAELRKVVWPTRQDVIASVRVVVISTIIIGIVLGIFDLLFVTGINFIFK